MRGITPKHKLVARVYAPIPVGSGRIVMVLLGYFLTNLPFGEIGQLFIKEVVSAYSIPY